MRKMNITLACLVLLCLCASCAAKTGDAALLTSPPVTTGGEPSDDKPRIEPSPSLTPSPPSPTGFEPTPSTETPPISAPSPFDPYNPEGWDFASYVSTEDEWWNRERSSFCDEINIVNFHIGAYLEDIIPSFSSEDYSITEGGDAYITTKKIRVDMLSLLFISHIEYSEPLYLYTIEVTGGDYATESGLMIGDSLEKLCELYGYPMSVQDSVWTYYDKGINQNRFQVTVIAGIVVKMRINQIL